MTLREAGQRVQPKLSRYTVASIIRTFRNENRIRMKQIYRVLFERNTERVKQLRYDYVQRVMELEADAMGHELLFVDEAGFNLSKTRRCGRNIIGHRAIINVPGQRGDHPSFMALNLPPYSPFLNPIEEFFSAWRWKVYDHHPHQQQLAIRLPDSLPIFELLVLATDEFPQLCVGVRDCSNDKPPTGQQLRFDIIELNGAPVPVPGDSGALRAVQVTQLDRDTVLITLERTVKVVNLQGLPSRQLAAEIVFDFPIETLVCLQDSVLAFWKHGLKGRSFHSDEVTQEITDESRVFRVLGTNRDIILQSTPTDDPSALSSLYILTGHESSY
uniref:mitogen-activated protein kinase kinase kinase kinase 5 n=1 Tax=Maylandia zebra TaxID=106582 RepID=UPI000D302151|nr:mitogen-activated protein kinase kinase kinase kinase 5 [Maylandia zebra]